MRAVALNMVRAATEPYGMILDEFAVVAADHVAENELGCAAFATRSLLAPRPADQFRQDRFDRRLRSLGVGAEMSSFRDDQGALLAHSPWFAAAPTLVLHEGYMVDPALEGSAEIEKLRGDLGDRFWATSPAVWDAWGNKGRFRQRCRELLGDLSVPPGIECSAEEDSDVVRALARFDADTPGTKIVKLPGGGGTGNVVLTQDSTAGWNGRVEELWGLRNHETPTPLDVVIEQWLPWASTHSVSFLIAPDHTPTFLAVCEQVVDSARAEFVGSRNRGTLSDADTSAMLEHLQCVFEAMGAEGYVGVAALDVIVAPGAAWSGRGLALPSGQRMCVIECNPRFNQHNRIGMFVERLARRWSIPSSELSWSFSIINPRDSMTLPALFASLPDEPDVTTLPAPSRDEPARALFAHRVDKAMELTVALEGRSAD